MSSKSKKKVTRPKGPRAQPATTVDKKKLAEDRIKVLNVIAQSQQEIGVLSEQIDALTAELEAKKSRRDFQRKQLHTNQGALQAFDRLLQSSAE